MYRQNAVQIFRPEVQYIVGEGDMMLFSIADGRPAHQHRAGVEAEHRIVAARQALQRRSGMDGPAHIVQENIDAGIAPARPLFGPEDPGAAVGFLPGAVGTVALKPLALGIVGQSAEHIHFQAVL